MAPKAAAADEKDPAAAAAAALTAAIESLQSDDPAVRSDALQSLATLCTSPWGESDVHDQLGVIMPTLLRLLEQDASALHFASTLAQLPWGTEALIRHDALPPLLRLTLPPPPPEPPPPPPPTDESDEDQLEGDEPPAAAPEEPIVPAAPAEPPGGWAHAGLACAVIGGLANPSPSPNPSPNPNPDPDPEPEPEPGDRRHRDLPAGPSGAVRVRPSLRSRGGDDIPREGVMPRGVARSRLSAACDSP